jgi:hypothetical protein
MSKFMVLVASAIFVTGVVVLAQQRSQPEGLPVAGAPQGGRADAMSSGVDGKRTTAVAAAGSAGRVCQSSGDAQRLCLAKLEQAARLVAN